MNLGTSLHWVSRKMQDKICLVEGDKKVSYSQLWRNIETIAKAFLKIGIKEKDKIVIFLPNCKEFVYSFYALARINAISVPLNPHLTSFELKKIFNDCRPKGIITSSSLYNKKIGLIFKGKKHIVIVDEGLKETNGKVYRLKELYSIGKRGRLPDFNTSNKQLATINYTYRGTGRPLGAMLTHGNYHHGAIGYVRLTEVVTSQRVLLLIPISHIFTLVSCVIVPLLRGATVVILKPFIPSHVFRTIEKHRIDFIVAVPTVYISLLRNYDKNKHDISSLKYGITGGSYLSTDLHKEIRKKMDIELLQGYGLTETMPITCNPRSKNKPDSLGIAGHEVRVRVVDKKGADLPCGKRGEILIGGPTVMCGYYNKNGENKKYLQKGWFWTGDYGCIDKDGYVYFKGLKKDIVKIGGNNVDLKEVRNVLDSFHGVKGVRLNTVKDDLWGHQMHAEVDVASKKDITEKTVRSFCRDRLAIYKIPKEITVTEGKN
ncbi:MAG: acyl--CoA ligase [Candidatus Omnitrophica bacterium]|nr:acyl--CoA ligase [Candidatus Omnitrophota bacterium]